MAESQEVVGAGLWLRIQGGPQAAGGPRPWGVLIISSSAEARGLCGGLVVPWQQVRPGVGVLSITRIPGAEAPSQRPRPGHKGRDHSIFPHRLEGRWPGPWAQPPSLGVGGFKLEMSVDPLLSFLARAPSPQPGLLRTGVRLLLDGWTPAEAPTALSRSDFDGHHVPDV